MQDATPVSWLTRILTAIQWPVIVVAAFWVGRKYQELVTRIVKTETNVAALVERHLPAIHRALAEIRGLLLSRGVSNGG